MCSVSAMASRGTFRCVNSRTAKPTPACLSTCEPSIFRPAPQFFRVAVTFIWSLYCFSVNKLLGKSGLLPGPSPISFTRSCRALSALQPPVHVRRRLRERFTFSEDVVATLSLFFIEKPDSFGGDVLYPHPY